LTVVVSVLQVQAEPVRWSAAVPALAANTKQDAYSCSMLSPQLSPAPRGASITQVALQIAPVPDIHRWKAGQHGAQLRQALLFDCDAQMAQLAGIQESENACIASTNALHAACNQW
jgi:hypothetical protein